MNCVKFYLLSIKQLTPLTNLTPASYTNVLCLVIRIRSILPSNAMPIITTYRP